MTPTTVPFPSQPASTRRGRSLLRTGLALAATLLAAHTACAVIVGPYTPDASTLHLWHMDVTAVPVPNAAPGGTNLTALGGGATLGNPSFPGFGNALSTVDGGQNNTNTAARDAYLSCLPLVNGAGDNVSIVLADPTTAAFTMEAIIHIEFDPAMNLGTLANGGNGRGQTLQIIAGEDEANAGRLFQFRLDPIGTAAPLNLTQPMLEFINVRQAAAGQVQNLLAPVPMDGADAIVSNGWYHVAVTYNGSPNSAENLKLYWTRMDSSRTAATQIGALSMVNNMSASTADFAIGNIGRNPSQTAFLGMIDEVRLSKVARGPSGMMFAPTSVSIDTHPSDQFVAAGDTVTLLATASGGAPIGYQWQWYGTNLPGANANSLVLSNISAAQAGPYRMIATNVSSSATSLVATVRVGANMNELFNTGLSASRTALPGGAVDPHWQMVQSDDPAYPGPNAFVVTPIPGVWLANNANSQWLGPAANGIALGGNYTFRTSFLLDTLDPANAQLTVAWGVDNVGMDLRLNGASMGIVNNSGFVGLAPVVISSGFVAGLNTLECVVSNLPGTGPNQAGLRAELKGVALPLASAPIQLVSVPADVLTTELHDASFAVVATGSGPLSYQWYHGATALVGQTARTLALTAVTPSQAGVYTVYVTNSLGYTNASATLTILTPPTLAWTGLNSGDWDTSTVNWLNTGTSANTTFSQNDYVTFDSRGAGVPTVNLVQPVTPNGIIVNANTDYTWTSYLGNGWLSGIASLKKSGSGTLIIDVTNNLTGPVTISAGTVQIGNSSASGSLGSGPVTNNAALTFTRYDALVVPNAISGSGAITNLGWGSTILTGDNSHTGPTVAASGTLGVRSSTALGTADSGTLIASFGQLFIDANVDITNEPLVLNGTGPGSIEGALHKGGGGVTSFGGPITLASDTAIKVDANSTLNLTHANGLPGVNVNLGLWADAGGVGSVANSISLGTGALTKDGAGTWILAGVNNAWQGTTISAGTLQIGNGTNDGSLPAGTVTDNGTLTFNGVNPVTVNNVIEGTGALIKNGTNTLTLAGANSYGGQTTVNGGTLAVVNNNSLGTAAGNTVILGGLGAVSRVAFMNNVTVTDPFLLQGRQPAPDPSALAAHLVNVDGTNTLTGAITTTTGGNQYNVESAAGLLVMAGDYSQVSGTGARFLNLQGAGAANWTGAINDGTANTTLVKRDAGTWTLSGTNNFSGTTTISGGTLLVNGVIGTNTVTVQTGAKLGGSGTITGPVTVQTGGTLAPGASVGTLAISNSLSLQADSITSIELNKAAGTWDQVVGLASVSYAGTLAVTNLAGSLVGGDSFQLFSAGAASGDFASVTGNAGSGLKFEFNSASGVLSVVKGTANYSTNLTFSVSGGNLTLSWPTTHLGWLVQAQTNSLNVGVSNNWHDIPGTDAATLYVVPLNPANPAVFYRLRMP